MEFSIRRKKQGIKPLIHVRKQRQTQNASANRNQSINSPLAISLNTSLLSYDHDIQSTIIDEKVRAKASMLLSIPITTQNSPKARKRQTKLSLMRAPKKRITLTDLTQAFKNRKKNQSNQPSNFRSSRKTSKMMADDKQNSKEPPSHKQSCKISLVDDKNEIENKRRPTSFYSLSDYFQLVFSKILSKPGKQKFYILIEELAKRYERYPETISQDVEDIRNIASKLMAALGPKQKYVELRPFEALEVNGEFARLIFHLAHEIATRKYGHYDLIKIYLEIEYCSRKLQFHHFTLKTCFQLGQLYKQKYDEVNSHSYYAKALKLSIYLNDKFHEEKAIDCFGLTAYSSNKCGQAHYFHENSSKLSSHQRQNIQEKYSNSEEVERISTQRDSLRMKNILNLNRLHNLLSKKEKRKETFNFNGQEYSEGYDLQNQKMFKQKINKYIQCPLMRTQILVAKRHITRIGKIGQITRYKNFQTSRMLQKFNEDSQSSSEVMLTHRSLNRKNPEYETRILERERKLLIELINYFTNQIISPK